MKEVSKTSKLGLDLIGETVTHKTMGEGIVVGYSPDTGEPYGFFYSLHDDKVVCFDHENITHIGKTHIIYAGGAIAIH